MRFFVLSCTLLLAFLLASNYSIGQKLETSADSLELEEVLIQSTRATAQTATTYSDLKLAEIRKRNFGQDMPFVINQMPSVVVNSDAGTGIGYTGIRVRGSDPTRINVTVNGIPLNDSESHGVFWVNMPDFASSVNNIQLQRGVGTSTNGAAAFGASLNLQTSKIIPEPYAEINETVGSFQTTKHTLSAGTGLLKDKFSFDLRLSQLNSDGFVDRASADLRSFYASAAYLGKKSLLRLMAFSGHEVTYQSWWGLPEAKLDEDRTYNYYTYENEVDDYTQSHYQLHYSLQAMENLNLNASLHYTKGQGFFEQYREDDALANYKLPAVVLGDTAITSTDLIRRRWLDNDFYGVTYSVNYEPVTFLKLTLGGAWNQYDGDHFGEIIWARFASNSAIRDRYYESRGLKNDFNTYLKSLIGFSDKLTGYIDLQYRSINYQYGDSSLADAGTDNDLKAIFGQHDYHFFNPKLGLTYQINPAQQVYASYSVGNREPVRSDFIDAPEGRTPLHESLRNLEAGYRYTSGKLSLQANYYWMDYTNQLVLTGELNDVGAPIRVNVPDSYRMGIELDAQTELNSWFSLAANATFSQNKIKDFTEVIYQYDAAFTFTGVKNISYSDTDISFSPNVIAGLSLHFKPVKDLEISLLNKYVGRQYLDNTQQKSRSLDPFFVNNLRLLYTLETSWAKEVRIGLLINNLLNEQYEPNGYTYNYEYDGTLYVENFYYPQAGTNFMLNLGLRF